MSGNGFDFGLQGFAAFWEQAGKTAMEAQAEAGRAFADAWKAMPGLMQAGGPMPLSAFSTETAELGKAATAVTEMWSAAATLSASLAAMLGAPGKGTDPTIEATFRAMADPRGWFASAGGIDTVVTQMAEGAQFADLWNMERQQAQLVQSWITLRRCVLEHSAVVLDAWLRAGQAFGEAFAERTRTLGQAPEGRAILSLWTSTANEVLLETQRSEKFLASQAAVLRAGAELRMAQRNLAQRWAQQFDLPTRTEIDDVHRTVTQLRRELRAVRHELKLRTPPGAQRHDIADLTEEPRP